MSTRTRTTRTRSRAAASAALAAALCLGLAACSGDDAGDGGDTATDPDATSGTPTPTEDSSTPSETTPEPDPGTAETVQVIGSAGVTEATMVHATEVGGSASTLAFALDTDQAVSDFTGQFDPSFAGALGAAIGAESALAPASTPYGATVAVGCDAPRSVAIDAGEAGFEVVPKLPKATVQCLAPMTYVVVFTVPDA
ncbi:hypothetical protein L2K70_02600 [Nocardioides KLBMP 9356]|uniref:Lipoprotein n=1 Tax=Nocardioides potassii TaxID=2911371 RepID=A0ABS9H890_9ACTN|nr:hypothetical protein [Nocardioides potassii]MCF6376482.1 hypothetical protein [Nocardioides potassii]